MKNNTQIKLLAIAVSLTSTSTAWALTPHEVRINDVLVLTPTLSVTETYDDNIRAVEHDEESSWVTRIAPKLVFSAEGRKAGYRLVYEAVSDTFHSNMDDNNTDHHVTFDASFDINARNRLSLNAGYHDIENVDTESKSSVNDHMITHNIGAGWRYGAPTAQMNLDTGINYETIRYRDGTEYNAAKERDSASAMSTFYYRVAPKTRLLAEARYADHSYVYDDILDNQSVTGLLGVTWDATAKTSGTLKFGQERKVFDDSRLDDQTSGNWSANVTWSPRTYSRFTLATAGNLDEGEDGASFVKTRLYSLNWSHDWGPRLSTDLGYSLNNRDFQDIDREDDLYVGQVGVTYKLIRWLDLNMQYRYSENDSNTADESFERNIYMLTLDASL